MPIVHRCDPKLALTVVLWSGPVSIDQWREDLRRRQGDPDFASTWKDLVDGRTSSPDASFTPAAIEAVLEHLKENAVSAGRAMAVLEGGDLEKLRFYKLIAEQAQLNVEIFHDLPAACAWLGVDQSRVAEILAETRKMIGGGRNTP